VVGLAGSVFAGELQVVSARQTQPGNVVVTVAHGGAGAPKATELSLRLSGASDIPAKGVSAATGPPVPTLLLLCVDRSGSIGPRALKDLKSALAQAITAQGATQLPFKVDVMAIGTRTEHLLGFTDRTSEVERALAELAVESNPRGETKLYDAIAGGLAELRAQGDGVKRLVIVSDGKDEGSALTASRLTELAQSAFPIDAIGYGALAGQHSGSLSSIAGATGGRFVQARNAKELEEALQRYLSAIVTPSFTVVFDYPAVKDNRIVEGPLLVYAVTGQPTVQRTLDVGIAAPAASAAPVAPDPLPTPVRDNVWVKIKNFVGSVPSLAWLLAAALAVVLAILTFRRRAPGPAPGPEPPKNMPVEQPETARPAKPARGPTQVGYAWSAPQPGRPSAILRGIAGTARGQQVAVDKSPFRIGGAFENDLVLVGDDFASGAHALLRAEAHGLYVEDLGSLNGSFLNGAPFKGATRSLSPGDEVRFGHSTFQVVAPQAAGGPEAQPGYEAAPS
jgi:hypothetical protein